MCGIAGVVGGDAREAERIVARMCAHMVARGPDDEGVDVLASDGRAVVLGSRRLAIIDPSPAGHQPMRDPERGTTLVFNGMIYNFRELRHELELSGERFASGCDTEVVLRAYGHWGVGALPRLRGMFALAIWDERSRSLLLARDRLGIKPLYYTRHAGRFAFASQVKTLAAAGAVEPRLSADGIRSFLSYGAVIEPGTILEDVFALPAGHVGLLSADGLATEPYWQQTVPADAGDVDHVGELRVRLERTVREHLVSDAPLGVFLSGGLDSSLLAAFAARAAADVRTVSVVFAETDLSERRWVETVARHIGSTHTSLELTPGQLLEWLPDAFAAMDQPSFDGTNTYAVSRSAAEAGLKVAVSGLGADELFDGYGYVGRVRALQRLEALPRVAARVVGPLLARDPGRAAKLAHWIESPPHERDAYRLLRRLFLPDEVERLAGPPHVAPGPGGPSRNGDLYRQISAQDLEHYTRNVLLRDTDCMSMANSLEVRVPYLDHDLVAYTLSLPATVKGERKRLLRATGRGLLPDEVLDRRKHGFLLPLDAWMRGGYANEVASAIRDLPTAVAEHIDPDAAAAIWEEYRMRRSAWLRPWSIYALARWTESLTNVSRVAA